MVRVRDILFLDVPHFLLDLSDLVHRVDVIGVGHFLHSCDLISMFRAEHLDYQSSILLVGEGGVFLKTHRTLDGGLIFESGTAAEAQAVLALEQHRHLVALSLEYVFAALTTKVFHLS